MTWDRHKSGEKWSADQRILEAVAGFPPVLRMLIADQVELLAQSSRTPSKADVAEVFEGFPSADADVLLRLWMTFSTEQLTAIAESGEDAQTSNDGGNGARKCRKLAALLTAAPDYSNDEWVDTVTWLTNLMAEMPEPLRLRLRELIEREFGECENGAENDVEVDEVGKNDEEREKAAPVAAAEPPVPVAAIEPIARVAPAARSRAFAGGGRRWWRALALRRVPIAFATTAVLGLFCLTVTGYALASARQDLRAEVLQSTGLRAEVAEVRTELDEIHELTTHFRSLHGLLEDGSLDDPRGLLSEMKPLIDLTLRKLDRIEKGEPIEMP